MSTHKETRLVHCYDPVAFVIAVEQGVKDGFSLDFATPEHYPQQIGWQFLCVMVKDAQQEVKNPQKAQEEAPKRAETATQDVKAKPGRPAKGKWWS